MPNKKCEEFFVKMPWGKIALIAWGDPANPPILMVHGYMDTAATFIPLVEELPDDKYYVAFDFPGIGKSDFLPPGLMLTHLHMVESIVAIVKHMKWENFIALSHSLGCIITVFYNVLFPGKITKMVNVDPGPGYAMYYYSSCDEPAWLLHFLDGYYGKYKRYNSGSSKLYTLDQAVTAIMTARNLSRTEAETSLSRMLVPAEKGLYRMSFDPRMKMLGSDFFPEETMITFIRTNAPPILNIISAEAKYINEEVNAFIDRIIKTAYEPLPNVTEVTVNGGHDAHITNAKEFVPHLVGFFNQSVPNTSVRAKL